jgi:hypothetical protein
LGWSLRIRAACAGAAAPSEKILRLEAASAPISGFVDP